MRLAQLAASGAAVVLLLCTPAVLAAQRGHKAPPLPKFGDPDGHFEGHGIKEPDACKDLDIDIGIALDGSGSVGPGAFTTMIQRMGNFITSSSGFPPANDNLYYISVWSAGIDSTSPRGPNTGDSQAEFVRTVSFPSGLATALDVALADQEAEWSSPLTPNPVVLVVTDGVPSNPSAARDAADSLKASPVRATIIVVAVNVAPGSNAATFLMNDVASTGPNGPLFVRLDDFDGFDPTAIVCCSIDTDGDGTVDCEDLCPKDPEKTDPGFCGCGEKDTFPCRCDLHEPGCKKHGEKHGKQ